MLSHGHRLGTSKLTKRRQIATAWPHSTKEKLMLFDRRALWMKFLTGLLCVAVSGCVESQKPLTYFGEAELNYYVDKATEISHSEVVSETASELQSSGPPHTISDLSVAQDQIRDLTLDEAFRVAMSNNRVLKTVGQFDSQYASGLLSQTRALQTVFDIAIQESTVSADPTGRGRRGVEDALSDFDATFTNQLLFGRSEQLQNNANSSGGVTPGFTLNDETVAMQSQIRKRLANSGQLSLAHTVNRSFNNRNDFAVFGRANQLFDTSYSGFVRAEYRQPLWAGSGTEFTRIAGAKPFDALQVSPSSQMSFDRGVVIARIDSDIALTDFETAVRDQMRDVESVYWDLYRAYRIYDDEILSRESALRNYRNVAAMRDRNIIGTEGVEQAKSSYFDAKSRVENSLADIFANENRLRRILGMQVSDGTILRPSTEPMVAKLEPEWDLAVADALSRRAELRASKWEIKRAQLQLRAANNMARPTLDFVMNYQVNGFGRELFDGNDNDQNFANAFTTGGQTPQGLRSFYETITQGNQTGWNLGFELGIPLGMRSINAQIRNLELRLAKAKGILADQELEITFEVARSFQELSRQYRLVKTNYNRWESAKEYRNTVLETQKLAANRGPEAIDRLLRAEQTLTDARRQYHISVVDYNKAIMDIHYRKGTLLTNNNIYLAEGLWDADAYKDALRRAWARSHATHKRDHMTTEPSEFVYDGQLNPASETSTPQSGSIIPPEPENRFSEPNDPSNRRPSDERPSDPPPVNLDRAASLNNSPETGLATFNIHHPDPIRATTAAFDLNSNPAAGRTAAFDTRPIPVTPTVPKSRTLNEFDEQFQNDPERLQWSGHLQRPTTARIQHPLASNEPVQALPPQDVPPSRSDSLFDRQELEDSMFSNPAAN